MSKLANNELNTENLQDTAQAENAVEITAKDEASTQQTEEVKVNADSLTENTEDKKSEDSVSADTDSGIIIPKIEAVDCTGTCAGCPSQSSCAQAQGDGEEYLLQVKNIKEYFPIKTSFNKKKNVYLKAVDGVSFNLKQGKTIGIVGESGCGKTTLGRTILRLYTPTAGEIIFDGKHIEKLKGEALRKMRPHFQMIFQDPYSSLSPRMTVGEIVGEAVKTHKIVPKSDYKDYIVDIMQKCGLQPHYFERYPHEFSGGQRQRICIAKALALKPKLVICDEPVSALDVSIQAQVINLFKDLQTAENLAYIFISHDLSVVEHISDEVGVMYLGNMVEFGSKKDLFANPMHPYTEALFSAVPIPDPDTKIKRIILQGDIPSPANPPKGCKFHTRCSKCMDICSEVEPVFKDYGDGHFVACHLYPQ
ncbi:MAG: dipeptide ABC transporter ATP-binding protein [Clostridia bacterium]|jgi:peptide/nickel transport system ATP-binding protein|nr:dipeptide ABC transporter ATP-binding protein [Clostridia bacterium]